MWHNTLGNQDIRSREQLAADAACLEAMQQLIRQYGPLAFQNAYYKIACFTDQLPEQETMPVEPVLKMKSFAELIAEANSR